MASVRRISKVTKYVTQEYSKSHAEECKGRILLHSRLGERSKKQDTGREGIGIKIAVASTDGKVVNQHFGRAEVFHILLVNQEENTYEYLEKRELEPVCNRGNHEDSTLFKNIESLIDCQYILVSKVGMGAQNEIERRGIQIYEIPGVIEDSVNQLLKYVEIQKLIYG